MSMLASRIYHVTPHQGRFGTSDTCSLPNILCSPCTLENKTFTQQYGASFRRVRGSSVQVPSGMTSGGTCHLGRGARRNRLPRSPALSLHWQIMTYPKMELVR